jgi:hypothetical protein
MGPPLQENCRLTATRYENPKEQSIYGKSDNQRPGVKSISGDPDHGRPNQTGEFDRWPGALPGPPGDFFKK